MSEAYSKAPHTGLAIQQTSVPPQIHNRIFFSCYNGYDVVRYSITQVECLTNTGLNTSVLSPNAASLTKSKGTVTKWLSHIKPKP